MANKSKGKIKITTSYLPTDSNQPARKVKVCRKKEYKVKLNKCISFKMS